MAREEKRAFLVAASKIREIFVSFLIVGAEFGQHGEVFQSGGVAFDFVAGGDLFEEAAHDFAGAGFGKGVGKANLVGFGDGADFLADVVAQGFLEFGACLGGAFEGDEGGEGLAFERIGFADDGGFGHVFVANQGAFDFGGADAVAGDVENVVNASHNPEIAVFILAATVAGKVAAGDFAPIGLAESLGIAPDAAKHAGPRFADDEFASGVCGNGVALVVDNFGEDAKEGQGGGAGFGWVAPGRGAIMMPPVSVCHQVSTMGQRFWPMTLRYHIHASGLMGSPTVPRSLREWSRCFLGHCSPHFMKARMAVGAV